jgi:hypothetical protein
VADICLEFGFVGGTEETALISATDVISQVALLEVARDVASTLAVLVTNQHLQRRMFVDSGGLVGCRYTICLSSPLPGAGSINQS